MTRNERLDAACALACAREPYFEDSYRAARALLNGATFGADVVKFGGGRFACTAAGCTCGAPACLHRLAWRLYAGEPA